MSLLDKIKSFFKREEESIKIDDPIEEGPPPPFSSDLVEIIHINPNVYLAHKAARVCIGKEPDENLEKRLTNLTNVIGVNHHESVAEHTNAIALFKIRKEYLQVVPGDFAEFMSNMKYCNVVERESDSTIYLLVGASARALLHLIRETSSYNYFILFAKEMIYSSYEKCFFKYLIENELLEEDKCTYLPYGEISLVPSSITQVKNQYENREEENYDVDVNISDPQEIESDHVDVVYMSPINEIYDKVKSYGFTLADVYRVSTITFLFHDISRSCSHQLVRHRNAISQESQRYVKQTGGFINPILLNREDKYSDRRFKEVIEKTHSIINKGFNEYQWLIDHRVDKEDARAFLPTNVITKVLMTMTYESYAKFLQLRLDTHAQKEIRNLAEETVSLVLDEEKLNDFILYCTTPNSLKKKTNIQAISVDEVIEEQFIEPTKMEINTQEAAQELLNKQEEYKKIEEKEI